MITKFTQYPDINEVLNYFFKNISGILEKNFVGMYVYGSLAMGGFEPETSDIDFIVITKNFIPEEYFFLLDQLHKKFHVSESKWSKKIEVAYVTQNALGRYEGDLTLYPQIEKGGELTRDKLEIGWSFQCHTLREYGIVVSGPEPKTLLAPVDPHHMIDAATFIVALWYQQAHDENESAFLHDEDKFVIMTLCRFLYLLHTKKICTKSISVQWAKKKLDKKWVDIIDLIFTKTGQNNNIKFQGIVNFIKYTLESLNNNIVEVSLSNDS